MKKLLLLATIAFTLASCAKEKVNLQPIQGDSPTITNVIFGEGVQSNTTAITVDLSVGVNSVTSVYLYDNAGTKKGEVLNPKTGRYSFIDNVAMPVGEVNKRGYYFIFLQSDGIRITSKMYDCFK